MQRTVDGIVFANGDVEVSNEIRPRTASVAVKAATEDFVSGLACSQAVLAAFAGRYGLGREHALRLATRRPEFGLTHVGE